ncbi:MAG: hypothetical protein EXR69_04160 [Myxococcales bacterium]|nr:hypothetical protein [Myxococcales bacterium]
MIRPLSLCSLFSLIALVACGDKADDTGGTDDTGGNGGGCGISVDSTTPAPNATDAYYRANIEFVLSDPDSTAAVTTTIPGHQETSVDGLTVIWVPDDALDPATAYSVTLDYCGGSVVLDFTTSDLGTSMSDPSALLGKTYVLTLGDARIVEPAGIGSVLSSYLTTDILLGVSAVSDTTLDIVGAVAVDGVSPSVQDFCTETIDFPTADFADEPFFTVGPQTTTLDVAGYEIEIGDLNITGTFAADGSYFDGGTLSGTIDTRPLAPLVDDSGNEGAICDLAVNFGAECEACSSDGQPYCLTLVADRILAEQLPDTELREVGTSDCVDCAAPQVDTDLSETCDVTTP